MSRCVLSRLGRPRSSTQDDCSGGGWIMTGKDDWQMMASELKPDGHVAHLPLPCGRLACNSFIPFVIDLSGAKFVFQKTYR